MPIGSGYDIHSGGVVNLDPKVYTGQTPMAVNVPQAPTVQSMLNIFHEKLAGVAVNLGIVLGNGVPPANEQSVSLNISQVLSLIDSQIEDIGASAELLRTRVGVL